jgi:ACS family hexuronate transporter-like MFS transporter
MSAALPAAPERPISWKWQVCGLLLFASMINYMDRQTLANVAVRITDEFHLSQEQYGNLELVFGWAFAIGSLLFGVIADAVSVRWLYPAVLCCWSMVGFATGFIHSYAGLLICRTLLGFFEAGHWPCGLKTTQRLLPSADRAMGNSVLQSGTSIGAVLTPLVMSVMLTSAPGGWRPPFQMIGGFSLLWVVVWLAMVRTRDLPAQTAAAPAGDALDAPDATEGAGRKSGFREIVFSRRFLVLIVMVACINTTWQLLRAWLPKILQQGRGYSESQALYFNSAYFLATDIGCLGAGFLTLWLGRRGWSTHGARSVVYLAGAMLTALTTVAGLAPKGPLLLVLLLIIGMGALAVFPCYYAFSQELTTEHQGKVTGLTGVFAWIFSAPVHKYFGRLVDQTGSFDFGLAVAGWLPLIGFVVLKFLWSVPKAQTRMQTAV